MIQDVKTVVSFDTTRLDNSLYVGLMSFTKDQFNTEFDTENPAPAKIAAQLTRYTTAYEELDDAYLETRKSSITPEIEAADTESDQLIIGIRQMVEGATRMTFDQERQQQATRFYDALKKYKIDTKENYLAENNKILQWIEEVESSATLTVAAQTLGLTTAIAQLKTVAQRLRQLIGRQRQKIGVIPGEAAGPELQLSAETGQQCRFAAAVAAQNGCEAPGLYAEVNAVQYLLTAVAGGEIRDSQHQWYLLPRSSRNRKNGTPMKAIRMPTGTSVGAKSTRPNVSDSTSKIAPPSAETGSSHWVRPPTRRRAMCGTISPTKPSNPA